MGNRQTSHQEEVQRSPLYESLSELFEELAETDDETLSIKKETFQTHFGSKVDDFDELLFSYIATNGGANRNAIKLTREEFITGFEMFLDKGGNEDERLGLYFTVFSDGETTMSFTDLVEMFHIARSLAFIVNERAAQDTHSEAQTIADVWARSILGADGGKHPDSAKFCNWAKKNCPRVFDGIHHWVARTLLSKGCLQRAVVKGFHGIPCLPEHAAQNHTLLNKETLWILSTILPPCFLGNVSQTIGSREQQSTNPDEEKAILIEWDPLYDSDQHGQSLNRFKHHSMAYHGPTATLIKVGKEELLVVAVDVEWRESSSSWGNSDCRIIQIRPKFQVLRAGPNLIFFNERARGLPSGMVLGQTSRPCVTMDNALTSAKLHYQANLSPQTVQKIEVWGCGGKEVREKQKTQQKWEQKQAEKLQKVKRPGRWDENPDKAILEMIGVTTNHSQR